MSFLLVVLLSPIRLSVALFRGAYRCIARVPVIAPEDVRVSRQSACNACQKNANGMCQLCACFISAKIMLSSEQCPDTPARWLRLK